MSQWKSFANVAGAPKWGADVIGVRQGSGKTNKSANATAAVVNTTPGTWKDPNGFTRTAVLNQAVGIFPVTPQAKANTSGESKKVHGLGWARRVAGEGPITSASAANGSGFANGETALITGGSANGTLVITSNATGNLASVSVQTAGLFTNTTAPTVSFIRELHVANLNFSNSTALTNVGNGNTINVSIGNTNITYGVNAIGSFTSNSTGGFTNTQTQAIVWSGANVGLFANNQTNTAVVVTFTNAGNGAVIGGTFTATANLVTSSGGVINGFKVGGRSGRVTYEMLVIDRHLANGTTTVANSTQLPQ